jgi:hypothetical protein
MKIFQKESNLMSIWVWVSWMGMGWVDIPKPIPIQDWSGWQTDCGEEPEAFQTE